ncbi:helix-turn-helix transcriptional regulator [Lysobacter sp. K5869]|uniref:helix-turn-helix domain-containing protein n=1 Tax=Lysobacter sp. K5869 TaxID=2820808 RepID=UPI001C06492F|nr:helix-turn-helix transcriptional regulator [Lysobacter sp. K5869]QWP79202.1 helix-turn-helix transcriptional regulator [Lysobacter sp. K5869]
MTKAAGTRKITEADQAAAARLKAIWLAIPRDRRPTQAKLAEMWTGNTEANQSLISQYMRGAIALNYKALLFFADALGCDPTDIRSDLPEQTSRPGLGPGLKAFLELGSQTGRPDFQKIAHAITVLHEYLAVVGDPPEWVTDPVLIELAYTIVAEFGGPVTKANVIDLTKRFGERVRAGGFGGEQGSVSGTGATAGTPHGGAARQRRHG